MKKNEIDLYSKKCAIYFIGAVFGIIAIKQELMLILIYRLGFISVILGCRISYWMESCQIDGYCPGVFAFFW